VVSPELVAAAPEVDGPLAINTAHSANAVSRLIEYFRKPRWSALTAAMADEWQEIENVLFQVAAAFDVDTAVGEQLDFLGREVGERRANRADADYRAAVRARRLTNASDGKPEQLYAIILALLPSATASLTPFYPASLIAQINGSLGGVTLDTVATLLRQAKLAGVRLDVEVVDAGSLIWAESDTVDLVNGWGSDTDPDLGGEWSQRV
jgi:hypothetical protein